MTAVCDYATDAHKTNIYNKMKEIKSRNKIYISEAYHEQFRNVRYSWS